MGVTEETRRESYRKLKPAPRQHMVLSVLQSKGPCTAREIANALHFDDLNNVKPRLTELKDAGLVKAENKAYDHETNRRVALWELAGKEYESVELDQTY